MTGLLALKTRMVYCMYHETVCHCCPGQFSQHMLSSAIYPSSVPFLSVQKICAYTYDCRLGDVIQNDVPVLGTVSVSLLLRVSVSLLAVAAMQCVN